MAAEKNGTGKPGRPRRHEGEVLKTSLSFRVTAGAHERLKASASASGRSISEEVERRIEAADNRELAVGGPNGTKFLRLAAAAVAEVQEAIKTARGSDWTDSYYARIMISAALEAIMDAIKPVPQLSSRTGLLADDAEDAIAEVEAREMAQRAGADIGTKLIRREALTSTLSVLEALETAATGERREHVRKARERYLSGLLQIASGIEDDTEK